MKINNFWKLVISVGVCELAGVIGSLFTVSAIPGWYATLIKSPFNPPGWVFGPVWTALYFLMGVAAFLIWRKGIERKDVRWALIVFDIQLALNAAWSIIFFGLHSPFWALVDIVAMLIAILAAMYYFCRISKTAVWLLVPYLLWVIFATYLNYSVWRLN